MRLGFLYPGHAAEDDYPRLAGLLSPPVSAELVHTSLGEHGDEHSVQALHDMGEAHRLAAGVAELAAREVRAVVWACTSGSFVYGWDGAHEQVAQLQATSRLPASSASLAFVHALRALGVRRVVVAATYPDDVAKYFVAFLAAGGVEVLDMSAAGIPTATAAGEVDDTAVLDMVTAADRPAAEAVLVPDTALHTVDVLPRCESAVGKPVLTANQVCVWEALRLVGIGNARGPAGRLFGES